MHMAVRHDGASGTDRGQRLALTSGVALAHVVLIAALVIARPEFPPDTMAPPVFDVLMIRSPPPGDGAEEDRSGGGAPAATSRIHTAPAPPPERVELIAPPVAAPLPELAIGPAIVPNVAPVAGLGGDGTGRGQGTGAGDGSGSGRGAGPVLVSGPRGAVMTANVSATSLAALPGPYAVLQCYIRVGRDRLEGCRVQHEYPAGAGVGAAALKKSEEFRYRPPTRVGRSRDRYRQTIAVGFPALPADPAAAEGGRH